ncbi:MAG: LuxR C-terminal-related transcriptional regulator [Acidimicrobiia bacterium]|nr:LuxR C-terminal-related transcriptional regulator [Acidimicrobiia bacterium]
MLRSYGWGVVVSVILFLISTVNLLLFAALAWTAIKRSRSEASPRLRALGWVAAAAAGAFVLGAGQRMALQATRAGWLEGRLTDFLLSDWQLIQSLTAMALGIAALRTVGRVWGPLGQADRMVSVLTDRVTPSEVPLGDLTEREREVLETIGSGLLSDRELAEALFIAPSTARTHVKNILRKTGLSNRRELMLVAAQAA